MGPTDRAYLAKLVILERLHPMPSVQTSQTATLNSRSGYNAST